MKPETEIELLNEYKARARGANDQAAYYAMRYLKDNKEEDRILGLGHVRDARIWTDAAEMFCKRMGR
jgi:hypothetical protein